MRDSMEKSDEWCSACAEESKTVDRRLEGEIDSKFAKIQNAAFFSCSANLKSMFGIVIPRNPLDTVATKLETSQIHIGQNFVVNLIIKISASSSDQLLISISIIYKSFVLLSF